MKALLVGYGEIGKAVHEVFGSTHDIDTFDTAQWKPGTEPKLYATDYDILLVAFGHSEDFERNVRAYQMRCGIKHTIIFSTVPIGTTRRLDACHCPVEGKHPNLAGSIHITDKWIGGSDKVCFDFIESAGFHCIHLEPEHTEFLKLRSTTLYGVNIEFARYSKRVADELGMDFEFVKQWDQGVNRLYADLGMEQYTRYILDAPTGAKGGHCVTPNAKILQRQYPDTLVEVVALDGQAH
jgi:hypothetical protein